MTGTVLALVALFVLAAPTARAQSGAVSSVENRYLQLSVDEDGNIAFVDREDGVGWRASHAGWVTLADGDRLEKIPLSSSRVTVSDEPGAIVVRFAGVEGEHLRDPDFEMTVRLTLEERQFEVEIASVSAGLWFEDVEYPAHLLRVDAGIEGGYVAVPHLQGILYPSRYDAGFMRYGQNIWDLISDQERWWAFESGNLNMPWFGAHRDGSSVLATVLTSSDCVLHVLGNALVGPDGFTMDDRMDGPPGTRLSSLSPIWKSQKGQLGYSRRMRVELVSGGYVGMAQRYKTYAQRSGRYVTLREKIERNPENAKIIGAPDIKMYVYTNRIDDPYFRAWSEPVLDGYTRVNTSFAEAAEIVDELHAMSVEKALVLMAGWNRMGYDREHVDMWPPAEPAGGEEGLRRAAEAARERGYLVAVHDNYDDLYPNAPSFDERYVIKERDGTLLEGGVWDGGPVYIISPAVREDLLRRNLPLVLESIPLNAYYLDVLTNTSHYEDYDPAHPVTRREDLAYRYGVLEHLADQGLVVGGERGADWAVPVATFFEGLSGGGTGYHRGVGYRTGLTAPLFYLVYRECVVGYWQHGTPHGREDHANHVLLDLLQGQPSSWSIEYDQWADLRPLLAQTYELLGRLHEKTAHAPMTDHRYLSADHMVQTTEFGDGTRVWVNFGLTTFGDGDLTIPPKGFRLSVPGEPVKVGTVARRIEYLTR